MSSVPLEGGPSELAYVCSLRLPTSQPVIPCLRPALLHHVQPLGIGQRFNFCPMPCIFIIPGKGNDGGSRATHSSLLLRSFSKELSDRERRTNLNNFLNGKLLRLALRPYCSFQPTGLEGTIGWGHVASATGPRPENYGCRRNSPAGGSISDASRCATTYRERFTFSSIRSFCSAFSFFTFGVKFSFV